MKNLFVTIALFSATTLFAQNSTEVQPSVDIENSTVKWHAYKVAGKHEGVVSLNKARIIMENGLLTGGTFSVDMTTINTTDLEGEWADKLNNHLLSPDFFDVENHKIAGLVITNVTNGALDNHYEVTADLTIKEITHPITFNVHIVGSTAQASLEVDRTLYNIQYGSGKFFQGLGDRMILDKFELEIDLVLE